MNKSWIDDLTSSGDEMVALAWRNLVDLMKGDNARLRLLASQYALDRKLGKPQQSHEIKTEVRRPSREESAQALAEYIAQIMAAERGELGTAEGESALPAPASDPPKDQPR